MDLYFLPMCFAWKWKETAGTLVIITMKDHFCLLLCISFNGTKVTWFKKFSAI